MNFNNTKAPFLQRKLNFLSLNPLEALTMAFSDDADIPIRQEEL